MQEQTHGTKKPLSFGLGHWTLRSEVRYSILVVLGCRLLYFLLHPYLEGHKLAVHMEHDTLEWILNLTDATDKLKRWLLRLSEFEFYVKHRGDIKNNAADALSRHETGWTDTADFHYDSLEMGVSIIEPGGGKIKNGNDRNSDLLCIYKHCGDIAESVNSALKQGAEIGYATLILMATKVPPSLEAFLQGQALYRDCRDNIKTFGFPAILFTYNCNGVLEQQAPLEAALRKHVSGALSARLQYLSHCLTLAGHPIERHMNYTTNQPLFCTHMAKTYMQQGTIDSHAPRMDLE